MRGDLKCVVCGGVLGFTWMEDHFDEPVCRKCVHRSRCWSCAALTGGVGIRAETVLPDGRSRCGRCSKSAVDRQSDVGAVVRLVRPLLHSYGIRLANPVRVRLVEFGDLRAGEGELLHGATVVDRSGGQVSGIKVVAGLPATRFGQVVAHEMGHGWLARCPGRRSLTLEEGICELIGSWWLRHRGGRLAAYYLRQLMQSADPIYGEGYRTAYSMAGDLTPDEVVRRLATTGRI